MGDMQLILILLLLTFFVSIYDFYFRKVPNWVTLPILASGVIAHFPGTLIVVFSSVLFILFWFFFEGRIGGGDVKLWLALLWALPLSVSDQNAFFMFAIILFTSGIQILLKRRKSLASVEYIAWPAAWKTAVYMLLIFVSSSIHYV